MVLFATPKVISDFGHPDADIARFLDNYAALTSKAEQTIVIFAVGNSDHILTYRGIAQWPDSIDWARYTDGLRVDDRSLDYGQVAAIVAHSSTTRRPPACASKSSIRSTRPSSSHTIPSS